MKNKLIVRALAVGHPGRDVRLPISSAIRKPPLPPVFDPASDPYVSGIYAEGIVESVQSSGENINVYPEVPGTVKEILVAEGQEVKGTPLLLDRRFHSESHDGTAEIGGRGRARHARRTESGAAERKTSTSSEAQVVAAQASLKTAQDALRSKKPPTRSIRSRSARTPWTTPSTPRRWRKQISKWRESSATSPKPAPGAYDIRNQERQYDALEKVLSRLERAAFANTRCEHPTMESFCRSTPSSEATFRRKAHTKATRRV